MNITSAIVVNNLSVAMSNRSILHDVTFTVPSGVLYAIIGHSGAGKTTLLKTLVALQTPTTGSIELFGERLCSKNRAELRKKIGYIPQDLGLVDTLSVKTNILMGAFEETATLPSLFGIFPAHVRRFVDELIEMLGLKEMEDAAVKSLSGGEKRRTAIARALVKKPKLLIADEFLSDLDFRLVDRILTKIQSLQETHDLTVVMVEHDMHLVQRFGNHISVMRQGRMVKTDDVDVSNKELLWELFQS